MPSESIALLGDRASAGKAMSICYWFCFSQQVISPSANMVVVMQNSRTHSWTEPMMTLFADVNVRHSARGVQKMAQNADTCWLSRQRNRLLVTRTIAPIKTIVVLSPINWFYHRKSWCGLDIYWWSCGPENRTKVFNKANPNNSINKLVHIRTHEVCNLECMGNSIIPVPHSTTHSVHSTVICFTICLAIKTHDNNVKPR